MTATRDKQRLTKWADGWVEHEAAPAHLHRRTCPGQCAHGPAQRPACARLLAYGSRRAIVQRSAKHERYRLGLVQLRRSVDGPATSYGALYQEAKAMKPHAHHWIIASDASATCKHCRATRTFHRSFDAALSAQFPKRGPRPIRLGPQRR